MPWLTPNAPGTGEICRALLIPNGVDFLAIVQGALLDLTHAHNFEQYGTLTPQQTADFFTTMVDKFLADLPPEGCRVIGEIVVYAGSSSPSSNFLACDGGSVLRADYPDLFAAIGTTYGSVDATHFTLPDLRGRAVIGAGAGPGLTPRAIGDVLGEEAHTLTIAEAPGHTHADAGHTHAESSATPTAITIGPGAPAPSALPGVSVTGVGNANLSTSGGDGAHNNMQPSLALAYYIVARNG